MPSLSSSRDRHKYQKVGQRPHSSRGPRGKEDSVEEIQPNRDLATPCRVNMSSSEWTKTKIPRELSLKDDSVMGPVKRATAVHFDHAEKLDSIKPKLSTIAGKICKSLHYHKWILSNFLGGDAF